MTWPQIRTLARWAGWTCAVALACAVGIVANLIMYTVLRVG